MDEEVKKLEGKNDMKNGCKDDERINRERRKIEKTVEIRDKIRCKGQQRVSRKRSW